jgi:hypothetical protein
MCRLRGIGTAHDFTSSDEFESGSDAGSWVADVTSAASSATVYAQTPPVDCAPPTAEEQRSHDPSYTSCGQSTKKPHRRNAAIERHSLDAEAVYDEHNGNGNTWK